MVPERERQAAIDVMLQLKHVLKFPSEKGERELRKLIDRQLTMSIKRVRKPNPE